VRGNPKDDLFRANEILTAEPMPCMDDYGDEGCAVHINPDDAKWLLELVEELLSA
jgi:hypothetical protein